MEPPNLWVFCTKITTLAAELWFIKEGQRLDRNVTSIFWQFEPRSLKIWRNGVLYGEGIINGQNGLKYFVEPQVVVVELVLQRRSAHHKWRESTVFQVL